MRNTIPHIFWQHLKSGFFRFFASGVGQVRSVDSKFQGARIKIVSVTILRDTVTTSWSADNICLLILNISCWSDILVLYVFSSTLPVLACYSIRKRILED